MIRLSVSLIVLTVMLLGCGEVVVFGHVVREAPPKGEPATSTPAAADDAARATPPDAPRPLPAGSPAAQPLHAVNLTLSPAVQAGSSGVAADALMDAIRNELRSRNLLDEQNPQADGTAEILITEANLRPTVNAVVFGYRMMAGTLTGDLRVSGASVGERPASRIVAESRLKIPEEGGDRQPLGPLYRRFAVLTADELTGVAPQPGGDSGSELQQP
jgi:hypothetical protein